MKDTQALKPERRVMQSLFSRRRVTKSMVYENIYENDFKISHAVAVDEIQNSFKCSGGIPYFQEGDSFLCQLEPSKLWSWSQTLHVCINKDWNWIISCNMDLVGMSYLI